MSGLADLRDAVSEVTQLVVDGLQLFLHLFLTVGQDGKLAAQAAQHVLHPAHTHIPGTGCENPSRL